MRWRRHAARAHVWAYRTLGGRGPVGRLAGAPVLLLTTTGRRTRLPRTTPLIYVPGDRPILVASNAGARRDPAWYSNLVAQPRVTAQIGGDLHQAVATRLQGPERAEAWGRAVAAFGDYERYATMAEREIPVVRLDLGPPRGDGRPDRRRMTTLTRTVVIAAPIEQVFDLVADPMKDPLWCPRVIRCEQRLGDGPGVGASYEEVHRPTLQPEHSRWIELTHYDPCRRVESVQSDQVGEFRIAYALEPVAGGTSLTQVDDVVWRVGRATVPLANRIVSRHMGSQLAALRRLLESRAGQPSGAPPP